MDIEGLNLESPTGQKTMTVLLTAKDLADQTCLGFLKGPKTESAVLCLGYQTV